MQSEAAQGLRTGMPAVFQYFLQGAALPCLKTPECLAGGCKDSCLADLDSVLSFDTDWL